MRQQWNLNGDWQFQLDQKDEGEREGWFLEGLPNPITVTVPHIWQTENRELVGYSGVAWYSRTFPVDRQAPGKRIFLHFDAVDYYTRVYVNGKFVGEHEGGFTPFEFDVSDYLRVSTENLVSVRVYDPQDNAEIPIGKQGSWYTRVSGIWQGVFLEERCATFIERIWVTPDIDRQQISVLLQIKGPVFSPAKVNFRVADHIGEGETAIEGTCHVEGAEATFQVEIPDAILWEPDNPHLYDLVLVYEMGLESDQQTATFGMRNVEYHEGTILLNGKPLYIRGALDQAFYPDSIYVAPSDEYIQNEIRLAKQMGFNLLRKHIKVEIPRYLYWADRMGLLIWAEPPNYVKWTAQGQERFQTTLSAMIERDYNHPSILIWSVYNEEWGLEWDLAADAAKQQHVAQLYDYVKKLDPTRLVCDNSGWAHVKTDVNDYHRYYVSPDQDKAWQQDLEEFVLGDANQNFVGGYQSKNEPILISEFGVWGLPSLEKLKQHYGDNEPWWFINQGEESHQEDYKKPVTVKTHFRKYGLDKIFASYEELAVTSQQRMFRANKSIIEEMRKRPGIAGYVVTEFTDIEWETNGWLDFLRNPKHGFERLIDFNGPLVIMVDQVKHNLWTGEPQSWDLVISNHQLKLFDAVVKWEIPGTGLRGEVPIQSNGEPCIRLEKAISFQTPQVNQAGFHELRITLFVGDEKWAENMEELTISPEVQSNGIKLTPYKLSADLIERLRLNGYAIQSDLESEAVVVTDHLDSTILRFAEEGGQVIFLAEQGDQLLAKGQFTFRHLPEGESWPRASSYNFVNTDWFSGIPLRPEMGWEVDSLIPNYVVPFSDYNKSSRRRAIHLFGNPGLADSCEIISGYFQGWLGQVGGSILRKGFGKGFVTLVTWRLLNHYGVHPIATQVLNHLIVQAVPVKTEIPVR